MLLRTKEIFFFFFYLSLLNKWPDGPFGRQSATVSRECIAWYCSIYSDKSVTRSPPRTFEFKRNWSSGVMAKKGQNKIIDSLISNNAAELQKVAAAILTALGEKKVLSRVRETILLILFY